MKYLSLLRSRGWMEAKAENGDSYTMTAKGWDRDALTILMNIIHGQMQKVPHTVDLEKLAKIAVIVEQCRFHRATHFFGTTWISRLKQPLPSSYGRELLLRLFVSHVFYDQDAYEKLTKIIIYESRGWMHMLDLPSTGDIAIILASDELVTSRCKLISGFISGIDALKKQLAEEEKECSFECLSISLGALLRGLKATGLDDLQSQGTWDDESGYEGHYAGYSVMTIVKALNDIRMPEYHQSLHHESNSSLDKTSAAETTGSTKPRGPHLRESHLTVELNCSLEKKIQSIIQMQLEKLQGLKPWLNYLE
ncbi:hypothetical protein MKX08_004024 [Trichoderma sp. CBMAI-0020]|nr:hypothetical protein MKX08_004024 [Trichoderma sp. CBMAI-0020]